MKTKRIIHLTIDDIKELIEDSYIDGYLEANNLTDQSNKDLLMIQADLSAREYVKKIIEDF